MRELINAGWPFAAIIILVLVIIVLAVLSWKSPDELKRFFARIQKVEFWGGSLTMADQSRVTASAEAAAREKSESLEIKAARDAELARLDVILEKSPRDALTELHDLIEEKIRRFATATENEDIFKLPAVFADPILELALRGLIAVPHESLGQFLEVSREVRIPNLSGGETPQTIREGINNGLLLLKAIPFVAPDKHFIVEAEIRIYHNYRCRSENDEIKGIRIKTVRPDGSERIRMFPYLYPYNPVKYEAGRPVTFTFDEVSSSILTGWYKDSKTGKPTLAWNATHLLFTGQPIH